MGGRMSLYTELKRLGIKTDNWESDLYFPVTPETTQLLADMHDTSATTFQNQGQEGGLWYDAPFAFDPWWERRVRK